MDIPNFAVSFTDDACAAGYGDSPAAEACSTAGPYTLSGCEAVYCPTASSGTVPGTSGTAGTSGCTVDPGYSGSITATTSPPYYDDSDIQAVDCPAGSKGKVPGISGTGGTSGCKVDSSKYTGSVMATSSPPDYYTSNIQPIECRSPADKSGYAIESEVLDVPNFAVSFTGGACAAFYEGTPKAEPCSAGEEYTLSGCTLIEYWYCTAGPGGNCYPFGDNAIDENGAARPGRAFPSGNWCADPGVASNDGHSCGEGDDPKGGHDASYSSFEDYCKSWSDNGGTFNGGKGQCPAGTCCS